MRMELEFYFKEPVRPIRLGEQRRADKTAEFNGELKSVVEAMKEDVDFENIHFVRVLDEEGKRMTVFPRAHGFDLYFKRLDDLLEFVPEFIKKRILKETRPMIDGIKEFLLQMSEHGYIYSVEQYSYSDVCWKLYEDRGNSSRPSSA